VDIILSGDLFRPVPGNNSARKVITVKMGKSFLALLENMAVLRGLAQVVSVRIARKGTFVLLPLSHPRVKHAEESQTVVGVTHLQQTITAWLEQLGVK
jgi:hypothetical protein